jgi:hypothetical protein
MPKDALDQEIETKRQELEEARERLGVLELELHTLERAAQLRPSGEVIQRATPRSESPSGTSRRGGRQSGAISKEWREILKRVAAAYPNGAMPEDIAAFGPIVGLDNLRPRDARQQAEKYVGHGYLERSGDRYRVAAKAHERFGFSGEPVIPNFIQPSAEVPADDDLE